MRILSRCPRRVLTVFLCCILLITVLPLQITAKENVGGSSPIGGGKSGLVNILLIGQDRRESETTGRSDSIILCSFNPNEKKIVITSFLRDLYVEIPDHQNNRLNAAYAFGGMDLLKQTMTHNFDLYIDGCIEADFSHFPQIIDTLGGVSIDLRQDEADAVNKTVPGSLTEGICLLSGDQALAYSRIRNLDSDGDFSRTQRQRKLIFSLLDSYHSADLLTILSVIADTLPMVTTSFSKRQIISLASRLFPLLDSPEIISQRIPSDGNYTYETIRNMEVLTADMEAIRRQLRHTLCDTEKNAIGNQFSS
jgi:LCP family protein required for cell wall assembly